MISTASVVVPDFLVMPYSPLIGDASPDSLQTVSCAQWRGRFPSVERRSLLRFREPQPPPPHRGRNRESCNGRPADSRGVRRFHPAAGPPPAAAVHAPVHAAFPPAEGTSPLPLPEVHRATPGTGMSRLPR